MGKPQLSPGIASCAAKAIQLNATGCNRFEVTTSATRGVRVPNLSPRD
jgi:hypothetical protein